MATETKDYNVLLIGDVHIGKKFTKAECNGENAFDYKIAKQRLAKILKRVKSDPANSVRSCMCLAWATLQRVV